MRFFNEKWNNSSILTKVSAGTMLLNTVLLLICTLTVFSWERALLALAGEGRSTLGFGVIFLIIFLYNALLTFGLIKVTGVARVFTILQGLGSVIAVIFLIAGIGYLMSYARAAVGDEAVDAAAQAYTASLGLAGRLFTSVLIPLIPANVLARIGFYLFIFTAFPVLQVLSMLILFFCKKDFKRLKGEAQPAL